jgi:RNA polymerase sigma factor (sigma-70 family)
MEATALTSASSTGVLTRHTPLLRLQPDEKLVALIREGYDRAFEVLFDRYQSRLLAFCRHMLRSPQDAEDVLQEVFAAAHAAMLADDRPINARPWLYRIARNRCLNHLRRPDGADGVDSMDVHAHENGATTLEQVQRREELRAIVSDVNDLPETQRTALVLREIDDLSYGEIAQAMGATMPAVKSLLVRARMSLAECSEARVLTCDDVRLELAEAAEGLGKLGGASRRHVRDCPGCSRYRRELRSTTKAVGALLGPFWLVGLIRKLIPAKLGGSGSAAGGSSTAAGGASGAGAAGTAGGAAGTAGGVAGTASGVAAAAGGSGITLGGAVAATGAAAGGIGGALGAKAAVGLATAALFSVGITGHDVNPDPSALAPPAAASAGVIDAVGGVDALADPPAAPLTPPVAEVIPPAEPAPAAPPVIPVVPAVEPTPVAAPPVAPPAAPAPPAEPAPPVVIVEPPPVVDPPPVDPPPVDPPPVDPPPVDPPPVDPPPVDPPPVDPPPVDPPPVDPPPVVEPPVVEPPVVEPPAEEPPPPLEQPAENPPPGEQPPAE